MKKLLMQKKEVLLPVWCAKDDAAIMRKLNNSPYQADVKLNDYDDIPDAGQATMRVVGGLILGKTN